MKSFTTGVRVRFFSVITPTGQGATGKFTGRILSGGRLAPNRNSDAGRALRNGPTGRSVQASEGEPHTTPFGGNFTPHVRNASAMPEPTAAVGCGSTQGSS